MRKVRVTEATIAIAIGKRAAAPLMPKSLKEIMMSQ